MKGLILCCFFFIGYANAESFPFQISPKIETSYLDKPLYIEDSKLNISLIRLDRDNPDFYRPMVKIDFLKSNLKIFHSIIKSIASSDLKCLNDSYQFVCNMESIGIPIPLEKFSCSIRITFINEDYRSISNDFIVKWGKCSNRPQGESDLSFQLDYNLEKFPLNSSSPYPQEAKMLLSSKLDNKGEITKRNFEVFAIGENRNGKVIWMGQMDSLGFMHPNSHKEFIFKEVISPWQFHEICKLRLVADPHNRVDEISKSNNEIELRFGLCEDAVNPEQKPDIAPWIEFDDETLIVHIANLSKVTIFDPIGFQIESWDSDGNLSDNFIQSIDQTLHGYGEEGTYHWLVGKDRACKFRISLDPKDHLGEYERRNNVIEKNYCQKNINEFNKIIDEVENVF